MTPSLSPENSQSMSTVVAPVAPARVSVAQEFVLQQLANASGALSLGELVRRGADLSQTLTPEETRSAIAALVDQRQLVLTEDLRVRRSSVHG